MSLDSFIENAVDSYLSELDLSTPIQEVIISTIDEAIDLVVSKYDKPGSTLGTFLSEALIEARDNADLSFIEDYMQDNIDSSAIAEAITTQMKSRVLRFDMGEAAQVGLNTSCSECHRPIGKWVGPGGMSLDDELVSSPGKEIIIVDDL